MRSIEVTFSEAFNVNVERCQSRWEEGQCRDQEVSDISRFLVVATPSYFNSVESEGIGRIQKAESNVHEGAFSRAAHLLTSSGLAQHTDNTL